MKHIQISEETYTKLLKRKPLLHELGFRPTFENIIKYLDEKAEERLKDGDNR